MKNKIRILPDINDKKIKAITRMATSEDWYLLTHQQMSHMLSFTKDFERINVYYTKMTVTSCLNHPKFGNTQLIRKNISMERLGELFKNPRIHTGVGYYTKDGIKLRKSFVLKKR